MKRFRLLAVVVIAVAGLTLAVAAPAGAASFPKLQGALLTGAAEAPGPGDPDGAGAVLIRLKPQIRQICVLAFATNNIGTPNLFHIHNAPAGVAGPVVVDFTPLLAKGGVGCVKVDTALAQRIRFHPSDYYFNVHDADFPAGAVRGQVAGIPG